MYSLGLDIGYTSFKIAVVNSDGAICYQKYQLHKGNPKELIQKFLDEISRDFTMAEVVYGAITGSGAVSLTGQQSISSVNEIAALIEGARKQSCSARSIIEIGGQSAKYITGLNTDDAAEIKIAMNTSCAAGTGSFLEEQVSRLNLKLEDYSVLAAKAKSIPRIAGRCSVFAKTDIIHHQQEGVSVPDILLGLAYAVVKNYRVSVMKKLSDERPILLAGGVIYNQGILTALKDVLNLSDDDFIVPEQVGMLSAIGAALIALKDKMLININYLLDNLEQTEIKANKNGMALPALSAFGSEDSLGKHEIKSTNSESKIGCYLGLDVGSTSTNLVLVDNEDNLIAYRYLRTLGDPISAVKRSLASLKEEIDDRVEILGACTTGSGRYITGHLIGADIIKDEITTQARAAVHIDPKVDTIFEIGGQDSKFISLKNGAVNDFQMNKICAAGTGSFIEEQAKKFNIPLTQISDMALRSLNPVRLGERCTVFMETSIASHLGQGTDIVDIVAGLCYAIVRNYLNRVVGQKKIGNRIFLQGGIAYNQGVINAFRSLTGKEIIVPSFFSVTGAYGAAIFARETMSSQKQTKFKGFNPVLEQKKIEHNAKHRSNCQQDSRFNTFINEIVFQDYNAALDPNKKTVGIPRALFTYGMFAMFYPIFTELGFNVLLSEPTSEKTIALGQAYSMDETCYPVKLINGHVAELVNKKVDYIFFPDLYTVDHPGSPSRQNYGCAFMQLAFKMVNQAMDLKNKGIELLAPTIAFNLGKEFMMKSFSDLGSKLGRTQEETMQALQKGMQSFKDFEARLEHAGEEALENLDPSKKAFVIISKIYGIADPVLNMGIPDKLMDMGYQVLPFFFMPEGDLSKEHPNMYWPFGQHILEPAQLVREHPNLYAVLLTHHGCGPDSVLTHFFKEEMQGKPYLHIEVDEHSSGVGVITRVEAFVNSLEKREKQNAEELSVYKQRVKHKDENIISDIAKLPSDAKLYVPPLYPYSEILVALLENKDYIAEVLSPTSRDSTDLGRKHTMVEEYFSLTALLGDIFSKCQALGKNAEASFLIPRNEGAEVGGQYSRLLRTKLDEENYTQISIFSPFMEQLLDAKEADIINLFLGMIAGDLILLAPHQSRSDLLQGVVALINNNQLTMTTLKALAETVRNMVQSRSWLKRILVVGEPSVIYNNYLNDYLFETLANKNHRIMFAPLSEAMWLFWKDYAEQNIRYEKHLNLLYHFAEKLEVICKCLGSESPFEKDLVQLAIRADETIGYYSGAFGRFRGTKVLQANELHVDGIITAASTYENTSISLNVLQKAFDSKHRIPQLNLTFDGNRNQNDFTKCEAFLEYL